MAGNCKRHRDRQSSRTAIVLELQTTSRPPKLAYCNCPRSPRTSSSFFVRTANDIETAKARVLQLSSESPDEFVVFRETDLQVVATSPAMQTDTEVLREFPQRLQSFAD